MILWGRSHSNYHTIQPLHLEVGVLVCTLGCPQTHALKLIILLSFPLKCQGYKCTTISLFLVVFGFFKTAWPRAGFVAQADPEFSMVPLLVSSKSWD